MYWGGFEVECRERGHRKEEGRGKRRRLNAPRSPAGEKFRGILRCVINAGCKSRQEMRPIPQRRVKVRRNDRGRIEEK